MGSGDTCVAGLWGNNGRGHVRGASVEGGVGPVVECIGVRLPGGRGGTFGSFLCFFSGKWFLFVSLVESWWWHGKRCFCYVVSRYVMCALPPFSATCPLFLDALWSTLLPSSARSQPLKLSTLSSPLRSQHLCLLYSY